MNASTIFRVVVAVLALILCECLNYFFVFATLASVLRECLSYFLFVLLVWLWFCVNALANVLVCCTLGFGCV